MACKNNGRLLQGYFDGELDLVRALEFEAHLKNCPECARDLREEQVMRDSLRAADLREPAPESLRKRIRAAIPSQPQHIAVPLRRAIPVEWLATAAMVLIALFVGARAFSGFQGQRQGNLLAQEIVAGHIRSLQPGHLFDVESTDQHTVKPWFDGRIDFAPPVVDLKDQGYPLVGGRLDYVDRVDAAALVYQRQKHLINVFVWLQESQPEKLPGDLNMQGYNLVFWQRGGMNFCATSDLNFAELHQLVRLLQQ